jgi:antitoxin ParD1/3/4
MLSYATTEYQESSFDQKNIGFWESKKMNISLGAQWEEFVSENVRTGRYLSASEVVREGLRLLQDREQLRRIRIEELQREVDKGMSELDRGEYKELSEEGMRLHMEEVKTRGRARLSAKKSKK